MFKFWQVSSPFYSPDDVLDTNVDTDTDTDDIKDDDIKSDTDILGDDDEVEEKDEDSKDEDSEEEEESEEDSEELVRVPYNELKDALKDNPKLLKSLKSAFFREQEFTKIFPTVEAAQNASQ